MSFLLQTITILFRTFWIERINTCMENFFNLTLMGHFYPQAQSLCWYDNAREIGRKAKLVPRM